MWNYICKREKNPLLHFNVLINFYSNTSKKYGHVLFNVRVLKVENSHICMCRCMEFNKITK